jgi:hypothetical protein
MGIQHRPDKLGDFPVKAGNFVFQEHAFLHSNFVAKTNAAEVA